MRVRGISSRRIWGALLTAYVGIALGLSPAVATPLSWVNPAGGLAATPANWSPAQAPVAADALTFSLANIYTVSWSAAVNASASQTYRAGTVTMSLSATHTTSGVLTVGSVSPDNATLTVTTGIYVASGNSVIANGAGSTGRINVDDNDAELQIGSDLTIGGLGNGTLSITNLGRVEVADQFLAAPNSGGTATVTVSGFSIAPLGASVLDVLGANESRIGAGGDATMTISNGAAANFASALVIANGSASTSTVTVQTAGLLNARLNVGGDLRIARNTGGGVAAGVGTLNVNTGGTVTVSGATFVGDPDGSTALLHMNGGTFTGTSSISVVAGNKIDGTGTINADISNSGNINPTGASGLTLGGILTNTSVNLVTGTKIHFSSTGGYMGSGECEADITGDAGALITLTGALAMGRATTVGVSYNGGISVGSQDLTLIDTNGAVLGGLVTMATGGTLTCANGIGIANGGRLQGEGTAIGNVTIAGSLDPHEAGASSGLLNITGDLLMNPSGTFDMDLKGTPGSGNYDRCNVSGTATFDGTLRVFLPTGYVPKVGEQFIAINATAGRTGTFANIIPPSPAPCNNVTFVLVYSSTAAIVLVRPPIGCTALGDLNSDGTVNGLDIQLMVNALISPGYEACADMNGDCLNNPPDVTIFLNAAL